MPHAAVSLLVIDDNPGNLELLSSALAQPGLEILTASDPKEGLDLFRNRRPQVVLTDLVMPQMSGMEVLERIVEIDPATDVILMSAHYSTESAVEAVKKGASDYLNKPISIDPLRERIGRLVEEVRKRQRALQLEDELRCNSEFEGIVGRSPLMWEMFWRTRRVAPHYRALLITGETGTGKDLIARALHRLSPVASGRYVVLNCSAVVETLFESELFGHVKGSFTGATSDKPGLFEHAHGGTLFLDEIGDMPLATQAKLLRVLQNQEVQRVGALNARKVDVRVIAATNHDLRAAVAAEAFSGGSILPSLHGGNSGAAAGGAQRGSAPAPASLCRAIRRAVREASTRIDASGANPAFPAFLAGQCAGTRKRHRTCRHDDHERHGGRARPAALHAPFAGTARTGGIRSGRGWRWHARGGGT